MQAYARNESRVFISLSFFFFNDTATTEIYTLSLHDALPIWHVPDLRPQDRRAPGIHQLRRSVYLPFRPDHRPAQNYVHIRFRRDCPRIPTHRIESRGHLDGPYGKRIEFGQSRRDGLRQTVCQKVGLSRVIAAEWKGDESNPTLNPGLPSRGRFAGRRYPRRNSRHETVPALGNRFDVSRRLCRVCQGGAEQAEQGGERRLFHKGGRPKLVHDALLREKPAGVANQQRQKVERLGRKRDGVLAPGKQALRRVQTELAESELALTLFFHPQRPKSPPPEP